MKIVTKDQLVHSYSSRHEPAATIAPGERFQVETHQRFLKDDGLETLTLPVESDLTAVTGPVYVTGARAGQVLKIHIHSIDLTDDYGVILSIPGFGMFGESAKEISRKVVPITGGYALFSESIKIPLNPHIGRIATAPANREVFTADLGDFGGNMDNTHICAGATVYLPVLVDGALLVLGDVHACMGDGESNGSGVECSGIITLECDLVEGLGITHPIIENQDEIVVTADGETLEEACRLALRSAARLFCDRLQLGYLDSTMLISAACDLRICQLVNPRVGVKAIVSKKVVGDLL